MHLFGLLSSYYNISFDNCCTQTSWLFAFFIVLPAFYRVGAFHCLSGAVPQCFSLAMILLLFCRPALLLSPLAASFLLLLLLYFSATSNVFSAPLAKQTKYSPAFSDEVG